MGSENEHVTLFNADNLEPAYLSISITLLSLLLILVEVVVVLVAVFIYLFFQTSIKFIFINQRTRDRIALENRLYLSRINIYTFFFLSFVKVFKCYFRIRFIGYMRFPVGIVSGDASWDMFQARRIIRLIN